MNGLDPESVGRIKRYLRTRRENGHPELFRVGGKPGEKSPAPEAPRDEIMLKTSAESAQAPSTGEPERRLGEGIRRIDRAAGAADLFESGGGEEPCAASGLGLEALEKAVGNCTRCGLSRTRTKTVFADGNPSARIMFIGEAPGRDEDLQGVPFVGRAGKLLDRILAAIGLTRRDVYIANILKCRPPGNRDPEEKEMEACEAFLRRQLEIVNPVIICALGRIAGQNLLRTKASLKVLREGIHYYNDTKVFVTYHPAALLRNPALKRPAWEDMKVLRRLYDEAVSASR